MSLREKIPEDVGEEKAIEKYKNEEYHVMGRGDKYLHRLDIGVFLKPKFMRCNTCPFAPDNNGSCDEFKKDADCIIERTFFDVLMQSMADQGVTDDDRLMVFPLAQKLFRLNRLYSLELDVDLRFLYDVDEETGKNYTLDVYKEIIRMIDSNEKGYIQLLKELIATRKERNSSKKNKKSDQSLSFFLQKLAE